MNTQAPRPPIGATSPLENGLTLKALLRPILAALRAGGPMTFAELLDAGLAFRAAAYDRHDLAVLTDTARRHELIRPLDAPPATEVRWALTARGERQLDSLASHVAALLITEHRARSGPPNPRYVRTWP